MDDRDRAIVGGNEVSEVAIIGSDGTPVPFNRTAAGDIKVASGGSAALPFIQNEEGILQTGNVRNCFIDDFGGAALDATKWDVVHTVAGATVGVANGELRITMPATTGVDVSVLSKDTFRLPVDLSFVCGMLAAGNANTEFNVELVEVDATGNIVAHATVPATETNNRAGIQFVGTSTTTVTARSMSQSSPAALTGTITGVPTLVTTGAEFLAEYRPEDTIFSATTKDATVAKTSGAVRHSSQSIDPEKLYKVRIRVRNTAASAAVTFFMSRILVADVQEMRVEVVSGRGDQVATKALPIQVINATPAGTNVIGATVPSVSSNTTTGPTILTHKRVSTADTNLVSVKTAAGRLVGGIVTNLAASTRYFKIYSKASAPVLASDVPAFTIALRAGSEVNLTQLFNIFGLQLTSGLAYAITGAYADTDTTAIAAGDVVVNIAYI